ISVHWHCRGTEGSAKSNASRGDCCQKAYSHFRHCYSPFEFYVLARCRDITLMFASHGIDADQNTAVCEAHRNFLPAPTR
ncbi:MAG TPA: hypothetical protein VGZ89_15075, partial [Xanthobacteraceae bacterium]|nr:hypothetical protein [Xanthobacteraceae bacterium]